MNLLDCLAGLAITCASAVASPPPQPADTYAVKPSDVAIPEGEALGAYRRVIQPFRNWILICDESLKSKRRVCNITQSIVNRQGAVVFSWSLVATSDGKPLMVMRTPAGAGVGQTIELAMGDRPDRIRAQTARCDATFCHATIAVGDMLKKHIRLGTRCTVSYALPPADPMTVQAPLDGLLAALTEAK